MTRQVEIQNILQNRLIDRFIDDAAAAGVAGLVVDIVKSGDDDDGERDARNQHSRRLHGRAPLSRGERI